MHISLNEVPSQNQLALGGITHKLIYTLKLLYFINVGQISVSCSYIWKAKYIRSRALLNKKSHKKKNL